MRNGSPPATELRRATGRPGGATVLEAEHLTHRFRARRGVLGGRPRERPRAVDDVTLELREGETLGLVGESGCGKTTLVRCLLRLLEPSEGTIRFRGRDVTRAGRRQLRDFRADIQVVFQDPLGALNPRRRVRQTLDAALRLGSGDDASGGDEAPVLLERVGLSREHLGRYPHELSGGQRQRVGIARALARRPSVILLDEPVSALDASVRAQIINLLQELQDDLRLTYLFVAHDLGVVRHVSDRVAVMHSGRLVEVGAAEDVLGDPNDAYTRELLAAMPSLEHDTSRDLATTEARTRAKRAGASRSVPKAPK